MLKIPLYQVFIKSLSYFFPLFCWILWAVLGAKPLNQTPIFSRLHVPLREVFSQRVHLKRLEKWHHRAQSLANTSSKRLFRLTNPVLSSQITGFEVESKKVHVPLFTVRPGLVRSWAWCSAWCVPNQNPETYPGRQVWKTYGGKYDYPN